MRENNENSKMKLTPNLGNVERVLSLMGGSYLLYDAIANRRKSILESISAGYLLFRGTTGYCAVYDAVVPGEATEKGKRIKISTSVTVNSPRSEVYEFWRNLENLPLFMDHIKNITVENENNSKWTAKGPGGVGTVSWEAVIVEEERDRRIRWKSIPGSTIENEGTVTFRDAGDNKTKIDVNILYSTPLGAAGDELAQLLTPVFKRMVKNDVKNFKQYVESGELAALETTSSGRSR